MVIHTTRWSPDSCGCVIEYTWDDLSDPETRVHTVSNIVNKCGAHQILVTKEEVFDTVLNKENSRKNRALTILLNNTPEGILWEYDENNEKRLKQGVSFEFYFTGTAPNRVLYVKFNGVTITENQRIYAQNKVDEFFGSGRIFLLLV